MCDSVNSNGEPLRKCSRCRSVQLLEEFFEKNPRGEWMKTCNRCRARNRAVMKKYSASSKGKAKKKEYNSRPEVEAKRRAYDTRPDVMARKREYNKIYDALPEVKAKKKEYDARPEIVAKKKAHAMIPEVKERRKVWQRKYVARPEQVAKRNEYRRNLRASNPTYRLKQNLRCRVYDAFKNGTKSAPTMELVGCTTEELKAHLEAQFTEGMTWENYGIDGWHIDHIRPCASFNLLDPEEQRICFRWSNLQPLWGVDNMSKNDTWQEKEDYAAVMAELLAR